jgi:hypothetical protein
MSDAQPTSEKWRVRLRCRMHGCCCAEDYPGCVFCGAALYDHDFIQIGWLTPIRNRIWIIRDKWRKRQFYCGKPVTSESTCLLKRGHQGECDDIPF